MIGFIDPVRHCEYNLSHIYLTYNWMGATNAYALMLGRTDQTKETQIPEALSFTSTNTILKNVLHQRA